ncbi:unnamed protein product [Oikopleura dioica]|uniref:Uncharacterized protein n=1 Tax=Oikopleura dioica TaxID=34765 RepID=E4WY68_OIKDI|nr:unnamed protein product [Oikopleura dioica]
MKFEQVFIFLMTFHTQASAMPTVLINSNSSVDLCQHGNLYGPVGQKILNNHMMAVLRIQPGRVDVDLDPFTLNTNIKIQPIDFREGNVVVTIQGEQHGLYLGINEKTRKIDLKEETDRTTEWMLEIDLDTKKDLYRNIYTKYESSSEQIE